MNHAVYIWRGPDNAKHLIMPERSNFVINTPFIKWDVAVPRGPLPPAPVGLGPGWRSAPQWKVLYYFGNPLEPDSRIPALSSVEIFELALTEAAWERILGAYSLVPSFLASPIVDEFECERRMLAALRMMPAPPAGASHPLVLHTNDLDVTAESFNMPGPPGFGGAAGPAGLKFVSLAQLGTMVTGGPTPMKPMCHLAGCLGELFTRAGRAAAGGAPLVGAELVSAAIAAANGNRMLSDHLRATKLPQLLLKCGADFPAAFRCVCATPQEIAADFETRISYLYGKLEDRVRIERERIFGVRRTHDLIGRLISLLPTNALAHSAAQSALALCLPRRTREPLADVLDELEAEARQSSLMLNDAINRARPFADILADWREHRQRIGSGVALGSHAGADTTRDSEFGGSAALVDLSREQVAAGLNEPSFARAWSAIAALGPLTNNNAKLGALAIAFTSDSWIIHRYLDHREKKLETKHDIFSTLEAILYLDCTYYGAALAMRPDGSIPKLAEHYKWGDKERIDKDTAALEASSQGKAVRFGGMAKSCKDLFTIGEIPQIDHVNAPGGYLELDRLLDGASEVQSVPLSLHYCTRSTMEGMQAFWAKAWSARGYAADSTTGDTWRTHCAFYVVFIKEGESLSGDEKASHDKLCDECFREDLRLIKDLHAERCKGRPLAAGVRRFDHLIDFGSPAKLKISTRRQKREELSYWREAAGFSSEKRMLSVPGVASSSSQRSRRDSSPYPSRSQSRSVSPSRGSDSGGSALSDVAPFKPSAPGSKAELVKYNGACTHFTLGDTTKRHHKCNAKGMAEDCGVDIDSFCWESGISTKPGDAKFALCTRWGMPGHDSVKSKCHIPPPNFDAERMRSKFCVLVDPASRRPKQRDNDRSPRSKERGRGDDRRRDSRRDGDRSKRRPGNGSPARR